jgi:O-acetyl-ADP-ribose deacetylase (regulator of RNase III)
MDDGWLDDLEWECIVGDIFDLEVDAVAIPVNVVLNLNYRLGRQLAARCGGPSIHEELERHRARLPGGMLALGTAVSVPVSGLPHAERAILAAWWSEENEYTDQLIYGVMVSAIREANAHRCASLGVSMFGARGGVSDDRRARVFARALVELHRVRGSARFPLKRLVFCDTSAGRLDVLEEVLDREVALALRR